VKINFMAALQGAGCIRFDDDHSAVVKLTIDGSEVASVVQLLSLKGKTFRISVDTKEVS